MIPVQIPFTKGQSEKWDKKLLPRGPLRAMQNAVIERDGRVVRRPLLRGHGNTYVNNGQVASYRPMEVSPPRYITAQTGQLANYCYEYVDSGTSGQEGVTQRLAALPSIGEVALFGSAEEPGLGEISTCPQVVYDLNGLIVTARMVGPRTASMLVFQRHIIEFRDHDTFSLVYRTEVIFADAIGIKLVSSPVRAGAMLFVQGATSVVGFKINTTPGQYGVSSFISVVPSALTTDGFDACADPTEDFAYVVVAKLATSPAKNLLVYKVSLADGTASLVWTTSDVAVPVGGMGTATITVATNTLFLGYAHYTGAAGKAIWYARGKASGTEIVKVIATNSNHYSVPQFSWAAPASETKVEVSYGRYRSLGTTGTQRSTTVIHLWDTAANTNTQIMESSTDVAVTQYATFASPSGDYTLGLFGLAPFLTDYEQNTDHAAVSIGNGICIFSSGGTTHARISRQEDAFLRLHDRVCNGSQDIAQMISSPPKPAIWKGEKTEVIFPFEFQPPGSTFKDASGSRWAHTVISTFPGVTVRSGETEFPGGMLHACDGTSVLQCGYNHQPTITTSASQTGGTLAEGTYLVAWVLEYVDAQGRLWRSAPSSIRRVTTITGTTSSITCTTQGPAGIASTWRGCRAVLYVSVRNGAVLFRYEDAYLPQSGGQASINYTTLPSTSAPVLYTQGGVLGNDAPPPCRQLVRTRDRYWAIGIEDASRIQGSKPLQVDLGVEWSDLDNFFVDFPGRVVGAAAMDDALVVLTESGAYIVHGAGPNAQGNGFFGSPQAIPGGTGCISSRSVLAHESGIFFQSDKGIELIGRGFTSPTWISQDVRDTIEAFPFCDGAAAVDSTDQLRWLMRSASGDYRVVVYDMRTKSWMVQNYRLGSGRQFCGLTVAKDQNEGKGTMTIGRSSTMSQVFWEDLAYEDTDTNSQEAPFLETGAIRVQGLSGWVHGRRAVLMGSFQAETTVTLSFAFDDEDFLPQDKVSWTLTEAEYPVGSPIQLEVTLPVMLFAAVRFRVTWTNPKLAQRSFEANGITVWFQPVQENLRVPARSKG